MTTDQASYAYRPRPFAAETVLTLRPRDILARRADSETVFPYTDIETIRLFYAPRGINFSGYRAKIYTRKGKTVAFEDRSHKSLIESERLGDSYRAFIIALCTRAEAANRNILLFAGKSVTLLALAGLLGLAAVLLLGSFAWNAFRTGETSIGLATGAFTLFFGAWTAGYIYHNRPRRFTAATIPQDILPPAS
ncbi:MAG: hypothetical protein LCH61_03525 [Proteobacteria bacterium]|nr:hypothetical protein [Pseudomonadota bacterium]